MNILENTLPGEWIYALGWTVLHSLWQATVVAVLIGLVLLKMQKQASWKRYWVAHLGWLTIIICSVITFLKYYQPQATGSTELITRLVLEGEAASFSSPSLFSRFLSTSAEYFNQHLPLIVSIWILGMSVFLLRLLGGLIFVRHLKVYKVRRLRGKWEATLDHIRQNLGLQKSVVLLESALIKVPMVIGWIKPAILVPIGALNALTPQQLEAVLAHELAHIKRHDYLLNLIRSLVEVLFYFNPAVWWLSAQIRSEREHCCDDMALSICGDSLSYVKALVTLQELGQQQAYTGLAMTFVGPKPDLLNRVRRILNQPRDKSDHMEKLMITFLLLLCLSFSFLSAGLPEQDDQMTILPATELIIEKYRNVESYTVSVSVEEESKMLAEKNLTIEVQSLPPLVNIKMDTIPKGTTHLQMTRSGKLYDVKIRSNEIKSLTIDGKAIPERELPDYYDLVQELLDEVPAPPAPPSPVSAPSAIPAPVVPPPPPVPHVDADAVPAPASPPAPPSPGASPAPPPPPPPPSRIILKKPKNKDHSRIEGKKGSALESNTHTNGFIWRSDDEVSSTVWVAGEDPDNSENVVIEVLREDALHDIVEDDIVLVDLAGNQEGEGAEIHFGSASGKEVIRLHGQENAFVFFDEGMSEEEMTPHTNWTRQMEARLLREGLLKHGESYQVEISTHQLIINDEVQNKAIHEQYYQFLEGLLGHPLDGNSFFFVNRNAQRME